MRYYVIYVKHGVVASFDILDDVQPALKLGEAFCKESGMKRPYFEGQLHKSKLEAVGNNCSVTIINRRG